MFLEYLEYILYGLIQGLTEFIPVSSTAHLKVISLYFGIDDPGPSLSAIIQIGSVFALSWYFKNDIILGGCIKLFIPHFFEKMLRSNLSIALVSLLMAIFMYIADISKKGSVNLKNHNYSDSLLIGISQAFAIVPGVSRSGVTISSALVSGWERGAAAKFSFLLGIPAISLAAIVEFISSFNELNTLSFFPLIAGLTTTFVSSLFAIDFLLNYFSSNGLKLFIIYRVVFGVVILLNL